MPFSNTSFDPETLLRMARAYEAAVAELGQSPESPNKKWRWTNWPLALSRRPKAGSATWSV